MNGLLRSDFSFRDELNQFHFAAWESCRHFCVASDTLILALTPKHNANAYAYAYNDQPHVYCCENENIYDKINKKKIMPLCWIHSQAARKWTNEQKYLYNQNKSPSHHHHSVCVLCIFVYIFQSLSLSISLDESRRNIFGGKCLKSGTFQRFVSALVRSLVRAHVCVCLWALSSVCEQACVFVCVCAYTLFTSIFRSDVTARQSHSHCTPRLYVYIYIFFKLYAVCGVRAPYHVEIFLYFHFVLRVHMPCGTRLQFHIYWNLVCVCECDECGGAYHTENNSLWFLSTFYSFLLQRATTTRTMRASSGIDCFCQHW